jgi:integrase
MPYQYVREPLTADESDRLRNACETPTERLVVWTLLDTGLRVSELCGLTSKNILWQQRQLRVKGKGGPYGKIVNRLSTSLPSRAYGSSGLARALTVTGSNSFTRSSTRYVGNVKRWPPNPRPATESSGTSP